MQWLLTGYLVVGQQSRLACRLELYQGLDIQIPGGASVLKLVEILAERSLARSMIDGSLHACDGIGSRSDLDEEGSQQRH